MIEQKLYATLLWYPIINTGYNIKIKSSKSQSLSEAPSSKHFWEMLWRLLSVSVTKLLMGMGNSTKCSPFAACLQMISGLLSDGTAEQRSLEKVFCKKQNRTRKGKSIIKYFERWPAFAFLLLDAVPGTSVKQTEQCLQIRFTGRQDRARCLNRDCEHSGTGMLCVWPCSELCTGGLLPWAPGVSWDTAHPSLWPRTGLASRSRREMAPAGPWGQPVGSCSSLGHPCLNCPRKMFTKSALKNRWWRVCNLSGESPGAKPPS